MARSFTSDERILLRSPNIKGRFLLTFYLDEGTYRFCDDVEDLSDGTNTYIGASALAQCSDIRSSGNLAAEPVTLVIDGTRIGASGFTDPASLFRDILALKLHQRRVDIHLGIAYADSATLTLVKPIYAGKINNARVVDPKLDFSPEGMQEGPGNLEITLDSLASRYGRVSGRTRSHADQQEIDPTDMFFSFIQSMAQSRDLYWGKKGPNGENGYIGGGGSQQSAAGGLSGFLSNTVGRVIGLR